jgi:hypothetical protein
MTHHTPIKNDPHTDRNLMIFFQHTPTHRKFTKYLAAKLMPKVSAAMNVLNVLDGSM